MARSRRNMRVRRNFKAVPLDMVRCCGCGCWCTSSRLFYGATVALKTGMTDSSKPEKAGQENSGAEAGGRRGCSRILGVDVGDRRIGLAISDPLGYTAPPLFPL